MNPLTIYESFLFLTGGSDCILRVFTPHANNYFIRDMESQKHFAPIMNIAPSQNYVISMDTALYVHVWDLSSSNRFSLLCTSCLDGDFIKTGSIRFYPKFINRSKITGLNKIWCFGPRFYRIDVDKPYEDEDNDGGHQIGAPPPTAVKVIDVSFCASYNTVSIVFSNFKCLQFHVIDKSNISSYFLPCDDLRRSPKEESIVVNLTAICASGINFVYGTSDGLLGVVRTSSPNVVFSVFDRHHRTQVNNITHTQNFYISVSDVEILIHLDNGGSDGDVSMEDTYYSKYSSIIDARTKALLDCDNSDIHYVLPGESSRSFPRDSELIWLPCIRRIAVSDRTIMLYPLPCDTSFIYNYRIYSWFPTSSTKKDDSDMNSASAFKYRRTLTEPITRYRYVSDFSYPIKSASLSSSSNIGLAAFVLPLKTTIDMENYLIDETTSDASSSAPFYRNVLEIIDTNARPIQITSNLILKQLTDHTRKSALQRENSELNDRPPEFIESVIPVFKRHVLADDVTDMCFLRKFTPVIEEEEPMSPGGFLPGRKSIGKTSSSPASPMVRRMSSHNKKHLMDNTYEVTVYLAVLFRLVEIDILEVCTYVRDEDDNPISSVDFNQIQTDLEHTASLYFRELDLGEDYINKERSSSSSSHQMAAVDFHHAPKPYPRMKSIQSISVYTVCQLPNPRAVKACSIYPIKYNFNKEVVDEEWIRTKSSVVKNNRDEVCDVLAICANITNIVLISITTNDVLLRLSADNRVPMTIFNANRIMHSRHERLKRRLKREIQVRGQQTTDDQVVLPTINTIPAMTHLNCSEILLLNYFHDSFSIDLYEEFFQPLFKLWKDLTSGSSSALIQRGGASPFLSALQGKSIGRSFFNRQRTGTLGDVFRKSVNRTFSMSTAGPGSNKTSRIEFNVKPFCKYLGDSDPMTIYINRRIQKFTHSLNHGVSLPREFLCFEEDNTVPSNLYSDDIPQNANKSLKKETTTTSSTSLSKLPRVTSLTNQATVAGIAVKSKSVNQFKSNLIEKHHRHQAVLHNLSGAIAISKAANVYGRCRSDKEFNALYFSPTVKQEKQVDLQKVKNLYSEFQVEGEKLRHFKEADDIYKTSFMASNSSSLYKTTGMLSTSATSFKSYYISPPTIKEGGDGMTSAETTATSSFSTDVRLKTGHTDVYMRSIIGEFKKKHKDTVSDLF